MQGNKLMKIFNFKSRKAISTIVGTFFFIIVMVGAFAAFILMMQTNSNFLNTQLDTTQNEIQKIQGQYTIAAAYDSGSGNRLCVSVKNSGSTPLEIVDILIVNKTNNAVRQFDVDFKDAFIPVFSIRDILENQPITLNPGIHDIKVVSTSGITQTAELKVFSGSSPDPRLNATIFAFPVNAASGQNVTLAMHVFNRANTTLINVQPNGDPTVDPEEAVPDGFTLTTSASIPRLDPNEDVLFLWDPEIIGGVGSKLNFTVSAIAQVEGCTTSSFITSNENFTLVKVVPGVKKEILASPETFITFPNPIGKSTGTGVFAVAILNPTAHAFKIPQVSIQLLGPTNPSLISSVTGVEPATGWDTTGGGQIIFWKDTTNQITVKPLDIVEFIVRVDTTTNPPESPVNGIIFNVYSSFGQFGKGPFTTGSTSATSTIYNVYSNSTFAPGGEEIFIIPDLVTGATDQRFNFTVSNFGETAISAGSYMLINIPSGLRDITNVTSTEGQDGLTQGLQVRGLLEFSDGSSQIPIKLTTDLQPAEQRSYSFRATLPSISVPAFYTFTIVSNGTTTGGVLLGPFSETAFQVCPEDGCE